MPTSTPATDESFIPKDWTDTAIHYGEVALTVLAALCIIAILGALTRYVTRYLYHQIRLAYLGPIQWSEIVFEGALSESEMMNSVGLVDNQAKMMERAMGGAFKVYFPRPMTAVAIRSGADDDSVHLYYGMDRRHYSASRVSNWATGSGCSAEPVPDNDIGIIAKAPVTALREGNDPTAITEAPPNATIGQVISSIQSSAGKLSGTVVISYEPMREQEENLLRRHIEDRSDIIEGHNSRLDGTPKGLSILTSKSPSRGTMTAFADDGKTRTSTELMETVLQTMPALGFRVRAVPVTMTHRRMTTQTIPFAILLAVISYFGYISWYVTAPIFALFLISLLGIPWMSSFWIGLAAKQGTVPIPPFFRHSLRRKVGEWWTKSRNKNKDRIEEYTGDPSCDEIIPFYQTSLMQFTSMPVTGTGVSNVASSAVPQVSMSTAVIHATDEDVESGDVIYEGMSAKSYAPVFRTVNDINFGIAIGGEPGSGKTNALQVSFLGMCRLSRRKAGKASRMTINPIWFETKSDDVEELCNLAAPYDPLFVRIHDTSSTSRLSLEGGRLGDEGVTLSTIAENKNQIISAMEALWGDSFGPRSRQVADSSLSVAMLLDKDGLYAIVGGETAGSARDMAVSSRIKNPDRPNVIQLMNILIGGDPSLAIAKSLETYAKGLRDTLIDPNRMAHIEAEKGIDEITRIKALTGALDSLVNLHSVRDATAPLQNKLARLLRSDGMFETVTKDGRERDEYSLDRFLSYGGPVILDLTPQGSELSRDDARLFVMLTHYMLWQRLQKIAGGWASQGKYTPLYADEITNFTGDANDDSDCQRVITEVRDQGRSYGVSHNVGFQRFGQLPPDVIHAVMSFPSKVFLKFENMNDATKVLEQLGERTRYAPENVRNFPKGIGIASMSIAGQSRPPFTIRFPRVDSWSKILERHDDIRDAFDRIYEDEMDVIKSEKKRKVTIESDSQRNPRRGRDPYGQGSSDDESMLYPFEDDRNDPDQDDGGPGLSWD